MQHQSSHFSAPRRCPEQQAHGFIPPLIATATALLTGGTAVGAAAGAPAVIGADLAAAGGLASTAATTGAALTGGSLLGTLGTVGTVAAGTAGLVNALNPPKPPKPPSPPTPATDITRFPSLFSSDQGDFNGTFMGGGAVGGSGGSGTKTLLGA